MKKKRLPKQLSHYQFLVREWTKKHQKARRELSKKHQEALSWAAEKIPDRGKIASSAIGALMLSSTLPAATAGASQALEQPPIAPQPVPIKIELKADIPQSVEPLTNDQEQKIASLLGTRFGMSIKPGIDGKRLNRSYGLIGAEQHLMRYPGDTMDTHLAPGQEMFYESGMASGRGAWGYFASVDGLTPKDIEREKWYIAVPTFESQDYATRTKEYSDFFKYRKMLVVNPKTGQAVVTDIADAGPATFTGKHLGGSPEVMYALGLAQGPRKGAVLYFFIDDPSDTISLGPIKPKPL